MLLRLAGYEKPDLRGRRPEGLWDAYPRMQGVQAFYDGLRTQPFIQMPLKQQPYGDWEFEVRDPNGYVLVFSGSQAEARAACPPNPLMQPTNAGESARRPRLTLPATTMDRRLSQVVCS